MKTEAIFIDRVRALKALSVNTQAVNLTCKKDTQKYFCLVFHFGWGVKMWS